VADSPIAEELSRRALAAGFNRAAVVRPGLLAARGDALRQARRGGAMTGGWFDAFQWEWAEDPGSWRGSRSILACCLSCRRVEPDDRSTPGDPHGLIAPFARAHYYRSAVLRLGPLAARLERERGLPRGSIRLLSNSRVPEKPLLEATGLAARGGNGLCLVPGLGSLFVIALAVIPEPSPADAPGVEPAADPCGSCRRCAEACPTRAIVAPGVVDPGRCLQGWAGAAAPLPAALRDAWGARLYGCHECQRACPLNAGLSEPALPAPGELGPSIPLRAFLEGEPAARARLLHGSALSLRWIAPDALLRNALTAAGHRGDPAARAAVSAHAGSAADCVRDAARWALDRLG
jgi:epoxyqueuosine reductase